MLRQLRLQNFRCFEDHTIIFESNVVAVGKNNAGAVLRIVSGTEKGTGYLIDAEQGYLLTAAHVVRQTIANRDIKIYATSKNFRNPIELKYIADLSDRGIDVALLRALPPMAFRDVIPLDLVLRVPKSSRPMYAFGYPRGEESLSQQQAENMDGSNGLMKVRQAVFPGDSGSPLIDETGKVVGLCISRLLVSDDRYSSTVAIYRPTADFIELLRRIPMSTRVTKLDQRTRIGIDPNELALELLPLPNKVSNLELIVWANHLKHSPAPEIKSRHFPCPILRALNHRKLEDSVEDLHAYSDSKTRSEALIAIAGRSELLQKPNDASANYLAAYELSSTSNDPSILDVRADSLRGILRLERARGGTDQVEEWLNAAVELIPNVPNSEAKKNLLAEAVSFELERGHFERARSLYRAAARSGEDSLASATDSFARVAAERKSEPSWWNTDFIVHSAFILIITSIINVALTEYLRRRASK